MKKLMLTLAFSLTFTFSAYADMSSEKMENTMTKKSGNKSSSMSCGAGKCGTDMMKKGSNTGSKCGSDMMKKSSKTGSDMSKKMMSDKTEEKKTSGSCGTGK